MPILGIVENFSGFVCPNCNTTHQLFGSGGGESISREMDLPLWARIPIDPRLMQETDAGGAQTDESQASPATAELAKLVQKIIAKCG